MVYNEQIASGKLLGNFPGNFWDNLARRGARSGVLGACVWGGPFSLPAHLPGIFWELPGTRVLSKRHFQRWPRRAPRGPQKAPMVYNEQIASGKLLGNFRETSGKLLGPMCSRPAFRSSNNKVNQLKIDTMKSSENVKGWFGIRKTSSIDLDRFQDLISDLWFVNIFFLFFS